MFLTPEQRNRLMAQVVQQYQRPPSNPAPARTGMPIQGLVGRAPPTRLGAQPAATPGLAFGQPQGLSAPPGGWGPSQALPAQPQPATMMQLPDAMRPMQQPIGQMSPSGTKGLGARLFRRRQP